MKAILFGGKFNESILYSVPDDSTEILESGLLYEKTDSWCGQYRVFAMDGVKPDNFFDVVAEWRRLLTALGFDSGPKQFKFRRQ